MPLGSDTVWLTRSPTTRWWLWPLTTSLSDFTQTANTLPAAWPVELLTKVAFQAPSPTEWLAIMWTSASVPVPWSTWSTRPEPSVTTYPSMQDAVALTVSPACRSTWTSVFCTSKRCW